MSWLRRYLAELGAGARALCSREFWRSFRKFWSSEEVAARMDDWTSRTRENLGDEPDWDVERRRARRGKKRDDDEDDA